MILFSKIRYPVAITRVQKNHPTQGKWCINENEINLLINAISLVLLEVSVSLTEDVLTASNERYAVY